MKPIFCILKKNFDFIYMKILLYFHIYLDMLTTIKTISALKCSAKEMKKKKRQKIIIKFLEMHVLLSYKTLKRKENWIVHKMKLHLSYFRYEALSFCCRRFSFSLSHFLLSLSKKCILFVILFFWGKSCSLESQWMVAVQQKRKIICIYET